MMFVMVMHSSITQCYVVRAKEISALNYLAPDAPRPDEVHWINRGTDQYLQQSSINQLLRTLHRDKISPSIAKLREAAGLRAIFSTDRQRNEFAQRFQLALAEEQEHERHVASAVFKTREEAELATVRMVEAGIPRNAVCILYKASQFLDDKVVNPEGHTPFTVAGATASGGVLGAMFGLAVFSIPGVGPVAAAGAVAASAFSSVAALSGVIGATGGALATVLSDFDVDCLAENFFERHIKEGGVVVTIDTRICRQDRDIITQILLLNGGHYPKA